MRLFRRAPSAFTWRQRLSGEAAVALQEKDISELRTVSSLMESLEKAPLKNDHPLRAMSTKLKVNFDHNREDTFLANMIRLEEILAEDSDRIKEIFEAYPIGNDTAALAPDGYIRMQTSLRLVNLQYYCKNLKEISESGEYVPRGVDPHHVKHIIDCFLLGSGAERISGHLRLMGNDTGSFTQGLLQATYYSLLEPEVATVSEAVCKILVSSKINVKSIKKMTPLYLLDKLELNVKSRCVFAWSDPKYIGYQPLDDDQVVSSPDIYQGNYEYFPESTSVRKQFVDKYISDRQMTYFDSNETRSNLKYGAVFFVVTCILDQVLSIM